MENMMELEDMMYSIRCQECPEGFPVVVGPQNTLEELIIKGQSVSEGIFFYTHYHPALNIMAPI